MNVPGLNRLKSRRSHALVLLLVVSLLVPFAASAQESPFGESSFVSPKFGTEIEWTDEWSLDEENSSIEMRRDVLGLIRSGADEAVLIELQSQRTFRSGEEFIAAALQNYSRLPGFEIVDDAVNQSPPNVTFVFSLDDDTEFAGYAQSQAIEGATMVAIVLAMLDDLDEAVESANDTITVNGVPLFEALPICGAGPEEESTPANDDSDKTTGIGGSPDAETECVEIFQTSADQPRPTPTPEPEQGRADGLNDRTWNSPGFEGVSISYDRDTWEVESDLAAEENGGRDALVLYHADLPSYIIVEVYEGHNGRAGACIDSALAEAGISPGTDELLTDADGNPIQGSQQGRVWAAFSHVLELEDGDVEAGSYVECRALPGAKGVMVITMLSGIDAFEQSYEDLQPVLRSVRVG